MTVKLVFAGRKINVVSAPQVRCTRGEKEQLWEEMEEVVREIPSIERVIIGADLNAHVGVDNTGFGQLPWPRRPTSVEMRKVRKLDRRTMMSLHN